MPFIDYNKAYDMVQRSWIINSLLLVQVAPNATEFVLISKLNGGRKIKTVNTWTVALLQYGGVIRWAKNELQNIDGMTRKVMTINRSCTQEVILQKIYLLRNKDGRELFFIHSFYFAINQKYNNSIQKYIKDNIQYSN